MKRNKIYKVIDGERDYQDKKWGGKDHDKEHGIIDWIEFMENILETAYQYSELDEEKALDELRQVVALGIACFEIHGVPDRVIPLPDKYV